MARPDSGPAQYWALPVLSLKENCQTEFPNIFFDTTYYIIIFLFSPWNWKQFDIWIYFGWKLIFQEPGWNPWIILTTMGSIFYFEARLGSERKTFAVLQQNKSSARLKRYYWQSGCGLGLYWSRRTLETFLGDINITSWRRHCQVELTRNNIDIANPDCLLLWHINGQRTKQILPKLIMNLISFDQCLLVCVVLIRRDWEW